MINIKCKSKVDHCGNEAGIHIKSKSKVDHCDN